jgi:hypothetical protein
MDGLTTIDDCDAPSPTVGVTFSLELCRLYQTERFALTCLRGEILHEIGNVPELGALKRQVYV